MKRIRILIVDDNESIAKCCSDVIKLKFINADVDIVGSAEEAKDKMDYNLFDLVITDLRLPDMQGDQLIKWINDTQFNTPVIAMSGSSNVDKAEGAEAFIKKPFNLLKFVNIVKEILLKNNRKIREI